jgi:Helix-turn-helix domain
MTRPPQRPEGALIQRAMERLDISARAAAARANISDTRWRHIVAGFEPLGSDTYREVIARPRILAKMAQAVDITPEQLEEAGRSDAATILRDRLANVDLPDELPDADLPTQIDWVHRQPWSATDRERVVRQLIELNQQAQEERRAAG